MKDNQTNVYSVLNYGKKKWLQNEMQRMLKKNCCVSADIWPYNASLWSDSEDSCKRGFPSFLCEWTLVVCAVSWPNPRLNKVNKVTGTNHNYDPVWPSGWHQYRSQLSIVPCWSTWRGRLSTLFPSCSCSMGSLTCESYWSVNAFNSLCLLLRVWRVWSVVCFLLGC